MKLFIFQFSFSFVTLTKGLINEMATTHGYNEDSGTLENFAKANLPSDKHDLPEIYFNGFNVRYF